MNSFYFYKYYFLSYTYRCYVISVMLFHIKILPLSLVIPTENLIYRNSIVRLPCEFLTYPSIAYTGLVSLYFKE